MRNLVKLAFLILGLPALLFAQAGGLINGTRGFPQANDGATGTTVNLLATINTSGNAIKATTGNTSVPTLIVVGGAGTTGNAALASNGTLAPCTMDATIASAAGGDFVIASTGTAGQCHPQSAAPSAGTWVVGYLAASSTTSGSTALVVVDGFIYGGAGSGGGGATVTYTSNQTAGTSDNGKLVLMNCSGACAYTLPATQPSTTWYAKVMTIGSTNATIVLGASDTFNGTTSVPVLNKFRILTVYANTATSTDYEGDAPLVAGANMTFTPSANGFSVAASSGGSPFLSSIAAATGSNTIANGNNGLQIWNWAPTSNQVSFQFGETTAASGGTLGSQYGVAIVTLSGSTSVPLNITDSLSGSQTLPALHITPTWNTSGIVDAALLINVTNTGSGAASKLIDAQIGGTSEFSVDKGGNVIQSGTDTLGAANCTTFGTAGGFCATEGTAPTNVSGAAAFYPDSTQHEFLAATNGSTSFGLIPRVQPSPINQTSKVAAITTATLCASSAGACNVAGQYEISWNFWGSGTACSVVTVGSVSLNLTWTDEAGTAHTTIAVPMWDQKTGLLGTAFNFNTALGTEGASGSYVISTNGTIIQYATTYTGCSTGTGTYNLRMAVKRLQ